MHDFFLFIIIAIIAILIGFTYFSFLLKATNKKGRTIIKWKIVLCKIFQIEFESEHENDSKK